VYGRREGTTDYKEILGEKIILMEVYILCKKGIHGIWGVVSLPCHKISLNN
jgi:hypothetical protein